MTTPKFEIGQRVMPIKSCLGIAGKILSMEWQEYKDRSYWYYHIEMESYKKDYLKTVSRSEEEILEIID